MGVSHKESFPALTRSISVFTDCDDATATKSANVAIEPILLSSFRSQLIAHLKGRNANLESKDNMAK